MQSFEQAPSLFRAYRHAFRIGAAIRPDMLENPSYVELIRRHFNSITAENIMKPGLLLDREATLALGDGIRTAQRFDAADRMLAFARDNGIAVRFHTLVWHNQTPRWFFAENWSDDKEAPLVSAEIMLRRQEAYIRDVMTHVNTAFPGVVYCWDVVNEAIEPDHQAPGCYRTKSLWYQVMGEEFVPAAFRAARKYQAPGQKLFYNDYNCAQENKSPAIMELLRRLCAENLVDGLGMQGHFVMKWPVPAVWEAAARGYASLGLALQVTELDIHCTLDTEEGQKELADRYAEFFDLFLRLKEDGILFECATFWGVTDRDSWLTGFRRERSLPLLFTEDMRVKPAFDAVLQAPGKREKFRVNQAGYDPRFPKPAVVLTEEPVTLEDEEGNVVRPFERVPLREDEAAGERAALIDLGDLKEGTWVLRCGGIRRSVRVADRPWQKVTDALIKGLYFQRCGCALKEDHAGRYTHAACHTAPAREWEHPERTRDASGGWHDAGDYGRYTGPGAVAAAHLMYAWLLFPRGCGRSLNIPESGNGMPDILNETRWELEWLLKMQREDGAFFHKVSTARFPAFIMPENDLEPEYLLPVSSCATADACACLALAAGIWKESDPSFSDRTKAAAGRAWKWLEEHPESLPFRNPEGVRTGQYTDEQDTDERFWAACELYAQTGDEAYRKRAEELYTLLMRPRPARTDRPRIRGGVVTRYGWADVTGLGAIRCLFFLKEKAGSLLYDDMKKHFLAEGREVLERVRASGYGTDLSKDMYGWGSTLPLMSGAITMILCWLMTEDPEMRDGALLQLHYALGLNPMDVSYITGFGEKRVMFPHHRPSGADGIADPVPGLISGGPNSWRSYPGTKEILPEGTPPAKCFLDETFSADTNEIAVYWNSVAILVFSAFSD